MNTYRPAPSSGPWITALKILILILALYVSAIILGHVFSWVFAIAFALIKVAVYVLVGFLLLHFFLKLLFQINLWNTVFGPRFRR